MFTKNIITWACSRKSFDIAGTHISLCIIMYPSGVESAQIPRDVTHCAGLTWAVWSMWGTSLVMVDVSPDMMVHGGTKIFTVRTFPPFFQMLWIFSNCASIIIHWYDQNYQIYPSILRPGIEVFLYLKLCKYHVNPWSFGTPQTKPSV